MKHIAILLQQQFHQSENHQNLCYSKQLSLIKSSMLKAELFDNSQHWIKFFDSSFLFPFIGSSSDLLVTCSSVLYPILNLHSPLWLLAVKIWSCHTIRNKPYNESHYTLNNTETKESPSDILPHEIQLTVHSAFSFFFFFSRVVLLFLMLVSTH